MIPQYLGKQKKLKVLSKMVLHQHPNIGTIIDINTRWEDKIQKTQQNKTQHITTDNTTQNNTGIKTNMTRHNKT